LTGGSLSRRVAPRRPAAEHGAVARELAVAARLTVAWLSGWFREPWADSSPPAAWRPCWTRRHGCGPMVRDGRSRSAAMPSPADPRAGPAAWPPAARLTARVHVSRPRPRPGRPRAPLARAPRSGPRAGARQRDAGPGPGSAATEPTRPSHASSSARPDERRMRDPGRRDPAAPPRGMRRPGLWRCAWRWPAACLATSWTCPISAPLTTCGWPRRS